MPQAVSWLFAGAMAAETLPLIQRLERVRVLGKRLVTGRLRGETVGVLTCGVGPERAERRTRVALQRLEAERVVSFGTCGALVDTLPVASVVVASRLRGLDVELLRAPALTLVELVTVRRAVATVAVRDQLATAGAQVCEMEAEGVWHAADGRPFGAIKVVSDLAGGGGLDLSSPGPLAILRFKALAARLTERHLAPALERLVGDYASSSV